MQVERECGRQVALDLMRMALTLLDGAGHTGAAARLQHAIDVLGEPRASGSPVAPLETVREGRRPAPAAPQGSDRGPTG